jgi:SAM-dependent methyltransferase
LHVSYHTVADVDYNSLIPRQLKADEISAQGPDMSLNNLIEYNKADCLGLLEKADTAELWDVFLEGQAKLFFDSEVQWFANADWWQSSKRILEIGCGNGAYIAKIADQFQGKKFLGIEKLPLSVAQAQERNSRDNVTFREGDAEVFEPQLIDSADIILFRLVLQHLNDPVIALKEAARYLSTNGHVLIIDAYDKARRTSHPITAIDEALALAAESQLKNRSGNRRITLDLLQTFEDGKSPLSGLYEVVFSNLDAKGNIFCGGIQSKGKRAREIYFNYGLLFLTLVHRTYQVPVNLDKAYEELKSYREDKEAWSSMGMHLLVLKKKSNRI